MKKAAVIIGSLVFAWIALAAPGAQAATKCTFYIVHGIPGQDIGKAADLPVDVSFNGGLSRQGPEIRKSLGRPQA